MTGKSALLKLFANRLRIEGEVIAFSVERFSGSSLSAFLQSIQVSGELSSILSAIGSAPIRCILIDGIERAKEGDKQRILNDLIISVESHNKSILESNGHLENCWRIVCTCRLQETENILLHTQFRKNLAANKLRTTELGGLSKEEIFYVSEKFPKIADLVSEGDLRFLIPFLTFQVRYPAKHSIINSLKMKALRNSFILGYNDNCLNIFSAIAAQ